MDHLNEARNGCLVLGGFLRGFEGLTWILRYLKQDNQLSALSYLWTLSSVGFFLVRRSFPMSSFQNVISISPAKIRLSILCEGLETWHLTLYTQCMASQSQGPLDTTNVEKIMESFYLIDNSNFYFDSFFLSYSLPSIFHSVIF